MNDPPLLAPYTQQTTIRCPHGHDYPAVAGTCPYERLAATRWPADAADASALAPLPDYLQVFIDRVITYKPARAGYNNHAYGYDYRKLGVVNHIPVCPDLPTLDRYFTGGQNQGLTHFGTGRETWGDLEIIVNGVRYRVPVSPVSQYLAIVGPVSPWAQGVINIVGACSLLPHPIATKLGSGVPNGAYISIENVAMSGADGVTDPQFNSNVFLRAICAVYFSHPINPDTQVWHGEIDRLNRCNDPGWVGLEDPMQDAARALVAGNPLLLRGVQRIDEPTPVPPDPEPTPPPHDVWQERFYVLAGETQQWLVDDTRRVEDAAHTAVNTVRASEALRLDRIQQIARGEL